MPPKKKEKAPSWQHSKAKQIMVQDMLDGLVPVNEKIKDPERLYTELYLPLEEFKPFPWHKVNVPGRIKRLQATVSKLGDSLKRDLDALENDRRLHPNPTLGHNGLKLWKNSEADRLLKLDMAAGRHHSMGHKNLRLSRPEYVSFCELQRFTKRIDQLTEAAKPYGKTPGQNKSKAKTSKKLPAGLPEESRKNSTVPYNNSN